MNPNDQSKPESPVDNDAMLKALEVELMQKRASWQKASAQRSTWRSVSFLFLFVVVMGVLFALYYVMTQMPHKSTEQSQPAAAESPAR